MRIGSGMYKGPTFRRLRVAGGVVVVAGVVCAVRAAFFATWLRMHYTPKNPIYRIDPIGAQDTFPRKLDELTARGWVYGALGLLVALAFTAASQRSRVRTAAAVLTLPTCAFAIIAALEAQGTIRWWGGTQLTPYYDDHYLAARTAAGADWALAAAALLTIGTIILSLIPAERRGLSGDLQLEKIPGYAG
jgi:hypothetical protein